MSMKPPSLASRAPQSTPDADDDSALEQVSLVQRLAARHRGARILIVENDVYGQEILAEYVHIAGLAADLAGDGVEALERAARAHYDLILMDVQMPVMDGVEAARTIRAAEVALGGPRIPILALTANALVHQVESYLAAGMDGHVSKPIELTRLYDAIETALASAATARAAAAA